MAVPVDQDEGLIHNTYFPFFLGTLHTQIGGNLATKTRSAIDAEKNRIAESQTVALLAQQTTSGRAEAARGGATLRMLHAS
jgi:hypothetical protein